MDLYFPWFSRYAWSIPSRSCQAEIIEPTHRFQAQASRWREPILLIAVGLFFWAAALFLQYAMNAYGTDLNVESDDPAHYVTGLMVHDYLRQGMPWPPQTFAQNYYAHYPKVALGHWPPVFYILQAIWMLLCGDSIHSVLRFMALLNALFAATLYRVISRNFHSRIAGITTGLFLLFIPIVQIFSSTVMADLAVAVFCQWAVWAWAHYLTGNRPKHLMQFAVFTSLAVLTKGNGYALLLVPPISIVLLGQFRRVKDGRLWACGALILVICTPWSFFTRGLVSSTMQYELTPSFFTQAFVYYAVHLFRETGFGVTLFVVIAIIGTGIRIGRRTVDLFSLTAISWLLAFFLFHALVPAGLEFRYLLFVLPAWLWLAANGIAMSARALPIFKIAIPRRAAVLSATAVLIFAITAFPLPERKPSAFSTLAKKLAQEKAYEKKVILVTSEGEGEGILISDLVQWDTPRPKHIVIRASRALALSDWNQRNYSLLFHSPQEILQYIRSIPIGLLVVDRTTHFRPNLHQPLIEKMLTLYTDAWKLIATYPPGAPLTKAVALYELTGQDTIPRQPISIEVSGTAHLKILVQP